MNQNKLLFFKNIEGKRSRLTYLVVIASFMLLFCFSFISAFNFESSSVSVSTTTFTGNLTNLSELQDVNIPSPTDANVLTYNAASGKWIDSLPSAGAELDPKWSANYTAFLNKVSWANVNNGTIVDANKVSWANVNNGTITTVETNWNANYSAFLNKVGWVNVGNGTLVLTSTLMNGSFFNVAETDSLAYNGTLIDNSRLNNGTYVTIGLLMNGSYFNPAASDTFIANYTAFLNKVNWADVENGTLALSSTLNNGSFFNVAETDSLAYNGTLIDNARLNNGTYITNLILNNGTYTNTDTDTFVANYTTFLNKIGWADVGNGTIATANSIWSNIVNGTVALNNGTWVLNSALNNGSYLNYPWNATNTSYYLATNPLNLFNNISNFTSKRTDGRACIYITATDKIECDSNFLETETKWNANYSTFLTHITYPIVMNGTLWTQIGNGTMAKSSELNNGTYRTVDNRTFNLGLNVTGTQNISIGNTGGTLCMNWNCSSYIRNNGTGIIIVGG